MKSKINLVVVPVSIGELWDKYTILQIKEEKINDSNKLSLVKNELQYLKDHILQFDLDPEMQLELKRCNEKLWDIEDKIRIKENKKEFDTQFIALARSVYTTNDKRAELKNKINKILGSDIVEVKSYANYT